MEKSPFNKQLEALYEFFPEKDVQWRVGNVSKQNPKKGTALAYIEARTVQQRLDDVVGGGNWKVDYQESADGKSFMCTISIWNPELGQWISKSDGAEKSDIEATKGGYSDAMKRAAVQWGIGRYLYDFPTTWVEVNEYKQIVNKPPVPVQFLLESERKAAGKRTSPAEQEPTAVVNKEQYDRAIGYIIPTGLSIPFEGKSFADILGEEMAADVLKYLAGKKARSNGGFFKPEGKDQTAVQAAAAYILQFNPTASKEFRA